MFQTMRAHLLVVSLIALGSSGGMANDSLASARDESAAQSAHEAEPGILSIEPTRVTFADGIVVETSVGQGGAVSVATVQLAPAEGTAEGSQPPATPAPSGSARFEMRRILRQIAPQNSDGLCGRRGRPTHLMIMEDEQQGWVAATVLRRRLLTWERCAFFIRRGERASARTTAPRADSEPAAAPAPSRE
jgi:hypothetical protein